MPFNLADFKSTVDSYGVAKSNLFEARIQPPSGLTSGGMDASTMSYFCMNASLPSFEVSTTPIKVYGYGAAEKRPTDFEFNDLTLTFIVDANFGILNTFHSWIQKVVNYDLYNGITGQSSGVQVFEFGYKDDYVGAVSVDVYSQNMTTGKYTYSFRGVYPTSVGELTPAWENGAEVMTLTVTFTYTSVQLDGTSPSSRTQNSAESISDGNRGFSEAPDPNDPRNNPNTGGGSEVGQGNAPQTGTESSGSITGYQNRLAEEDAAWQSIYEDNLDGLPGYPDDIPLSLERNARSTAHLEYKAGLISGEIEPPSSFEENGVIVVTDEEAAGGGT